MEKAKIPDDVILVGSKPFPVYMNSIFIILEKYPEVKIKSRGKKIPAAIKMVNKLIEKYDNFKIKIDKIQIENNQMLIDGKDISVPSLIITLKKQ